MRRLVIIIAAGLAACLWVGSAYGINITTDTLSFKDTLHVKPGDTVNIPIYLSTDSAVSGMTLNFSFNPEILWPIIWDDYYYDTLVARGIAPDSADFTTILGIVKGDTSFADSGLWYMDYLLSDTALSYLGTYATVLIPYNFNSRSTTADTAAARLLFFPGTEVKSIPGRASHNNRGVTFAYIRCRVNPNATNGKFSNLHIIPQSTSYSLTELSEEWVLSDGTEQSESVTPTFLNGRLIVDTSGVTPPPANQNKVPVVAGISPSVYSIKQGQSVSFTVTATDAEGGTLKLYADRNSTLPANASFSPSNPVVGAGGTATGTFSFSPGITQEGTFAFTFQALDDSGAVSAIQTVTVAVAELEYDHLYTTSAEDLAPQGGVPGLNEVLIPINVVTKKTLYGIQFDLAYDATNFKLDSVVPTDRMPNWVVYDNVGVSPGSLRVVAFGLSNDTLLSGTSSAVVNLAFTVDDFATAGCYALNINNAWESISPDPNVASLAFVTDSGEICVDKYGDVNLDRRIDVADLVNVVAYIIGNYDLTRRQFAAADIVVNDTVNVVDLVAIINTIFGIPIQPAPVQNYSDYATLKVSHDEISSSGVTANMAVEAEMPTEAAGVQLDIQYNPFAVKMLAPVLADGVSGFKINYQDNGTGKMKVLIYSMRPWNDATLIQSGLSKIISLPFVSKMAIQADDSRQVRITQAFISTGSAKNVVVKGLSTESALPNTFELYQNRPNPFNPTTTIDFYLNGSNDGQSSRVTLEIFNIVGQKVKTLLNQSLPSGQYSVVWDGSDDSGQKTASGVYLYRLRVGSDSQTKKMVLLK